VEDYAFAPLTTVAKRDALNAVTQHVSVFTWNLRGVLSEKRGKVLTCSCRCRSIVHHSTVHRCSDNNSMC
jgi:hypothetical protein